MRHNKSNLHALLNKHLMPIMDYCRRDAHLIYLW